MAKPKQIDLEDAIASDKSKSSIERPTLWSSCCPYRIAVDYVETLPSMTKQEFAEECDVNVIMKTYEATGIMPVNNREPIYWDHTQVPDNLQDAMEAMNYANELFMQLPAVTRKEFDNDPVKFVDFATNPTNTPKLKEWGLTAPETPASAPIRVEVVAPSPPPGGAPPEPPKT